MKYFEKNAASGSIGLWPVPKNLAGAAIGATIFGLSGYSDADKDNKWTSTASSALLGGVLGAGAQGAARAMKKSFKTSLKMTKNMSKKDNPLGQYLSEGVDPAVEKSKRVMDKLKRQEDKIRSHKASKSGFMYEDAVKYVREKKAATFRVSEKDLTNKELQHELRRPYFEGSLQNMAFGGTFGATASLLNKGKSYGKNLLTGVAAGLIATPIVNALDKKDILKEVDRRKKHKGYR
ncbi:hypothetical protein AYK24_00150 [Thermoplasmatales archaeon SG8-52-4]|nr:MAG: hypothetical protein AYK24_00150 [Thermoplasmatales archaeon SG8-52-4]